jgi:hypothetical protein
MHPRISRLVCLAAMLVFTFSCSIPFASLPSAEPLATRGTQPPIILPPAGGTPAAVFPSATPTNDKSVDRTKSAKILVYEDTADIGLWVKDALDGIELTYIHVGDAVGNFMEELDSGVDWDLIIVASESHKAVQGEFWDVIGERVQEKNTALIAELWYLDQVGGGRIKPLLIDCGINYQKNWNLADSIYWLTPEHPIFNEPNHVEPLLHYSRHWPGNAGDLIRLTSDSKATMLAGISLKFKTEAGVLATCFDGRVIFQTFSNHDFHHEDILPLWQNYITYVLENHFATVP